MKGKKCACGKLSSHTFWIKGCVKVNMCCECYVLAGNPPADWHQGCMKTYNETKLIRQKKINVIKNTKLNK